MDKKLESKYFESTISALKKAKAEESFQINAEFAASLKERIIARAEILAEPAHFNWVDTVMQFKYILGGVPALAILAIVVFNMNGLDVKMENENLITENAVVTDKTPQLANDTVEMTADGINTFSADEVMPPDDVLEAYWRGLESQEVVDGKGFTEMEMIDLESPASVNYMTEINTVKIEHINPESLEPKSFLDSWNSDIDNVDLLPKIYIDKNAVGADKEGVLVKVENNGNVVEEDDSEVKIIPVMGREENSGMVDGLEDAGKGVTPTDSGVTVKSTDNNMITEVVSEPVKVNSDVMVVDPKIVITDNLIKDKTILPAINVSADKVRYVGEDRTELVGLVLDKFSYRNGSLSSGYTISVENLDGTYQVVLMDGGKLKDLLVLFKNREGFQIIKHFSY